MSRKCRQCRKLVKGKMEFEGNKSFRETESRKNSFVRFMSEVENNLYKLCSVNDNEYNVAELYYACLLTMKLASKIQEKVTDTAIDDLKDTHLH